MRGKRKLFTLASVFTFSILFFSVPSYAGTTVQNSTLFQGLQKLIEDAGKALIIIALPIGGLVATYCFIRRGAADEMDHKKWTNRITTTIISTIGAIVVGAIIALIAGYFNTGTVV